MRVDRARQIRPRALSIITRPVVGSLYVMKYANQ